MPHQRIRHILPLLEKLVAFSPLVGVLGHRQVGKTTLLSQYSKDYRSFDSISERKEAQKDIEKYVSLLKGDKTVIDESQLVPELFSALKERVRTNKRPGQFLLSGSVRFTSRRAIRESLTGRIQYLELLPFSVSEIEGDLLPDNLRYFLESKDFSRVPDSLSVSSVHVMKRRKAIEAYLSRGGLPGVCFIREDKLRKSHVLDQLQTILDRDIRQVYPTSLSYQQILDYVRALAISQGQPIRFQELRRETEITPVTQRKLLYALEAVFLIRRIPIEGGRKGFTIFLEDQAESHILAGSALSKDQQLVQLLYRNIRTEFVYRLEKDVQFFQYRSLGGVVIPLALRYRDRVLGFIPIHEERPSRAEVLAGQSFLKAYSNSGIIFFHQGRKIHAVSNRLIALPIEMLL